MTILDLIDRSHSLAKEKGFWEVEKNQKEDIMLILANLGEIVKAHKKHKFADWVLYNDHIHKSDKIHDSKVFHNYFNVFIKDTFEDEIANVVLRITDFFGGNKINILSDKEWLKSATDSSIQSFFRFTAPSQKYCNNVGEWLERAITERSYHANESDFGLLHILFYLGTLVEEFKIDIERHITAKLDYNSKRPTKYGNNY